MRPATGFLPAKKVVFSAALAFSLAAPQAALAEVPDEIQIFTGENMASCKDAGGTPRIAGQPVQGAGRTAEGYVPYLTQAGDLNGDGPKKTPGSLSRAGRSSFQGRGPAV